MSNSKFNAELYAETLQDEGIQYDSDIKYEVFDSYMIDYK